MRYLILLSFLPYLRTSPLSSDVQPHVILFLLLMLVLVIVTRQRFPTSPFTLALSVLMVPIGIFLDAGMTLVSLVLVPIYIDFVSRRPKDEFLWAAKAAVLVYYLGIVINIVAPELLAGVVPNFRTTSLRGFNSFTSEPSYLGLVGLAITMVLIALGAKKQWIGMSILLVFLSGSATAVFPLVIYLGLTFLKGRLIVIIPVLLLGVWYLFNYLATTDTRLGGLLNTVLNSPELILLDVSVSNRIFRGIGPLLAAANDLFRPHNFNESISLFLSFLSDKTDSEIIRLSSLATVLIYGLGWLSLPLFIAYGWVARAPISIWFMVIYLSITNISFATPYLWTALAVPIVLARALTQRQQ